MLIVRGLEKENVALGKLKVATGLFFAAVVLVMILGATLVAGLATTSLEILDSKITGLLLATFVISLFILKGAADIRSSIIELENTKIPTLIYRKLQLTIVFGSMLFVWALILLSMIVFAYLGSI